MDLLTMSKNKLEITPYALAIKEFADIWSQSDKDNASLELSFIYFMADFKSPYVGYDDTSRPIKIAQDLNLPLNSGAKLKTAILKYEQLQDTPSIRLLKATERTLNKIEKYYDAYIPEVDVTGAKFKSIVASMKSLDGVIKSISTLRKQVELELVSTTARGGHSISKREVPKERRT